MNAARLSGQHALVTGAARGIGAAIAAALAREGADITLMGRHRDSLEAAASGLPTSCKRTIVVADVTNRDEVSAAFGDARNALGPISILINNAGQAASAALHKADDALWEQMLAVNLTGVYYCIRAGLPDMLAARVGRIVNVASTAGLTGYAYVTAYCAAKHGVIGLTRALAMELAKRDITVNAVCPGFTDTDLVRATVDNIKSATGRSEEEALSSVTARNPQRRLVRPEEVADAVVWLCLPGSASVTGQSLTIAGGEVM